MNYSEVKELLEAGFTADEIRGMMNNPQNSQNNPQPAPQPDLEPQPDPEPQPEPKPAPQPEPKPAPQPKPVQDDPKFEALNNTMERLIKTIQSSNLQNSHMETPSKDDINKQVDSIMSSIIRPEHEKEDSNK